MYAVTIHVRHAGLYCDFQQSIGLFCKTTERTPAQHVGAETRRGEHTGASFKNFDSLENSPMQNSSNFCIQKKLY